MTDWTPIIQRPGPPLRERIDLRLADGAVVVGWRVYDSMLGQSFYWADGEAKGWLRPVKPVAWRLRAKPALFAPDEPIGLREIEVLLQRAILMDGSMRAVRAVGMNGSWRELDAASKAINDLVDDEIERILPRFVPESFDIDNYLPVMGLFCAIARRERANQPSLTREQDVLVLRAYGLSYEQIGDRVSASKQTCWNRYNRAVERARDVANQSPASIVRLPRFLYADAEGDDGSRAAAART